MPGFEFTEAQILAWLSPVLWPFLRVLAVFTSAPVLSSRAVPMRVKIALALLVALACQATIPTSLDYSIASPNALGVIFQQVLIGLSIGFAVRLVFAAMELAGEVVGFQMGLNFAAFFDPSLNSQSSAVARFFGQMATLLFVVLNGHIMVLMAVTKSFEAFPVSPHFWMRWPRCSCTGWGLTCLPVHCGSRCPSWACCCSSTWRWVSFRVLRRRSIFLR